MVLWEITLGTAYFLGLKRTYRLALRIQRRLISPKHPKIRQFVRSIQQRDIEVGRNLGNWILRWLDRMKPSAQIRGPSQGKPFTGASSSTSLTNQATSSNHLKTSGNIETSRNRDSNKHLFTAYKNVWPRPFASISVIRVPNPVGSMTQYRHSCVKARGGLRSNYTEGGFEGVIRKDILQWMHQN